MPGLQSPAVLLLMVCLVLATSVHAQVEQIPSPEARLISEKPSSLIPARDDLVRALETSLLKMFGLGSRPRPRTRAPVPDHMLQLYRQQVSVDVDTVSLPVEGRHTQTANTVRSFTHQDTPADARYPANRLRLLFNLSSIPASETLKAAELKLFKPEIKTKRGPAKKNKKRKRHFQQVLVYDMLRPGRGSQEPIVRLIDSKMIDTRRLGWESLDILPAAVRWLENPKTNHGLIVQVRTMDGEVTEVERVRLKRNAEEKDSVWQVERPMVLTYTDDGKARVRTKRGADRKHKRKGRRDNCRRHSLYVDFGDVGWNDWIIAPPGYNAYYCHGDCPFPLSDHLNSTNHAIVQTLVNSVKPSAVPRACCVPTELSPISMLYQDEYEKVVLKNYQDMVVQGCGCR